MAYVPQTIHFDGSWANDRLLVVVDGHNIRLTARTFKYLLKLAWAKMHTETGWVWKDDIERGNYQSRYLYRLKDEIKQCYQSEWKVFDNNRQGSYRIVGEGISFNVENLLKFPDYEVTQLFQTESQPVEMIGK